MWDPDTVIEGNGFNNFNDLYLYFDFMERKDPRKLGREAGGKEVEVRKHNGDTAPALQPRLHRADLHLK